MKSWQEIQADTLLNGDLVEYAERQEVFAEEDRLDAEWDKELKLKEIMQTASETIDATPEAAAVTAEPSVAVTPTETPSVPVKKEIEAVIKWAEHIQAYKRLSGSTNKAVLVPEADLIDFLNGKKGWIQHLRQDAPSIAYVPDNNVKVQTSDDVPPGYYEMVQIGVDIAIRPKKIAQDSYVDMSGILSEVIDDIAWWLKSSKEYKDLGMRWRRGLLLYGPPGNGKTRTVLQAVDKFKDVARVIELSDISLADDFRTLLGSGPVIFLIEEITEITNREGLQALLNFLDGVDAWDNAMVIATTNYPEQLPGNVVDRPSRFDRLYMVDNPSVENRRRYLSTFLDAAEVTTHLIDITKDYSIAYLRELVVQHKLYNKSIESIIKEQEKRKDTVKHYFKKNKGSFGFMGTSSNSDDEDDD